MTAIPDRVRRAYKEWTGSSYYDYTDYKIQDWLALLAYCADRAGADYWGVTFANKTNNRIIVGCDYPRDNLYEKKWVHLGDEQVTTEAVIAAIEAIEEYREGGG